MEISLKEKVVQDREKKGGGLFVKNGRPNKYLKKGGGG